MLFLPDLLNQHHLFLRLNGLEVKNEKQSDLKESILNHGTDAILRMERIRNLNYKIIREFDLFANQLKMTDEKIVFASNSMGAILGEIPPLLSTLRILQNKALAIISLWQPVSLPSSINSFCKNPKNYKVHLKLGSKINKYWEKSGKLVKFYRDIDQHSFSHSALTSRYFIRLRDSAETYVEFPDFKQNGNQGGFRYSDEVSGLEFLDDACFQLHELIEEIATHFGARSTPHRSSIRMDQLGDLIPYKHRTLGVLYEEKIQRIEGENVLKLSALRFDQNGEGKLVVQNMSLDGDDLIKASQMYGLKNKKHKKTSDK